MGGELLRIAFGLLGTICGIYVLMKTWKKHKRIDTESIAIFNSAQDIGRDGGGKVYAIKYDVQSSEPFELLVAPCKKVPKNGKKRTVYYEKANPNANHYFKTIGTFDRRLLAPVGLLLFGVVVLVAAIVGLVQ